MKQLSEEDWKEIADVYGYVGHLYGQETICLDGDFSLNDLKRIAVWFEKRLEIEAKS